MEAAAIAERIEERRIEVGGVMVTYFDSVDASPDRPPIVLVHGTGGSTATHYPFLLPMLAGDRRVISVDLANPGTGTPVELADLEAQVVAVIEESGAASCSLVGYSLGAVVAASIAGHRPDLVENLVLIAGWMRTDQQQKLRNDIWRALRESEPKTARQFSVYTAYSAAFLKLRSPDELDDLVASVTFDEFKDLQMALNRRIDITASVEKILAKTLVIGCRDDFMVPPRHARELFGAIPHACYLELGSGHAVVAERPAELVHWIGAFTAHPDRFHTGTVLSDPTP